MKSSYDIAHCKKQDKTTLLTRAESIGIKPYDFCPNCILSCVCTI